MWLCSAVMRGEMKIWVGDCSGFLDGGYSLKDIRLGLPSVVYNYGVVFFH